MRIGVYGLWHLGCVTAACLAEAGFQTIAVDADARLIAALQAGRAPIAEPGLEAMLNRGMMSGRLEFTADLSQLAGCDLVWITMDAMVDQDDVADTAPVTAAIENLFPDLREGTVVLVSTQLPAGTTTALSASFTAMRPRVCVHFACAPENLQLGNALAGFRNTERIVVGVSPKDRARTQAILEPVLQRFTQRILWMSPEAAELTKHALNGFLALSVTFANEIARLCELVGADASEVEQALRLEPRIGARAYLRPGSAFAGGTLARDVRYLNALAAQTGVSTPLLDNVLVSNELQKQWPLQRLTSALGSLTGKRITILGLATKLGSNSLRRSWALDLSRALAGAGAIIRSCDPGVSPEALPELEHVDDPAGALQDADAAVVALDCPQFLALTSEVFLRSMRKPIIIDPNGYLRHQLGAVAGIDYVSVGSPVC